MMSLDGRPGKSPVCQNHVVLDGFLELDSSGGKMHYPQKGEIMQSRLAAILAADMVGYSRLMGADAAGTVMRQKANRKELIDPAIKSHHGRIFKVTGDGFFVEFSSIVDAVKCAVEIQRIIEAKQVDVPKDRRIYYRIGINLGEIIEDEGDIFGDGVNVAARIEGLAPPRWPLCRRYCAGKSPFAT